MNPIEFIKEHSIEVSVVVFMIALLGLLGLIHVGVLR